jgi:2-polyprenyl-6-methoxyphenol hydroxylase-like FAD-dependent oxidoreductase
MTLKRIETQVLIVGAGPVGLTAAMDLASRGIDVVVAEMRRAGEPPNVNVSTPTGRDHDVGKTPAHAV